MTRKRAKVPGCVDIRTDVDGKLYVRNVAQGNHATLSHSEMLSSRQRVFDNIIATCKVFNSPGVRVRDLTGPKINFILIHMGPEPRVVENVPKATWDESWGE